MEVGFDPIIGALDTSLNLREINQNVISSNIANADTPGYKAKAVEFETALRDAFEAGPGHRVPKDHDPVEPEIFEDPNGIESMDGNTVDRSAEMTKMHQNEIMYNASAEMLKRKLGMLKYAISEGGGGNR